MVQNVIEQNALVGAFEGRGPSQQLEQQNAKVPNVERLIMTSLFDHLWGEVLGRSTVGLPLLIIVSELIRPAKISQLDRPVAIKKNVLRLDVPVDDGRVQTVQVLASTDHFSQVLSGNTLTKPAFAFD